MGFRSVCQVDISVFLCHWGTQQQLTSWEAESQFLSSTQPDSSPTCCPVMSTSSRQGLTNCSLQNSTGGWWLNISCSQSSNNNDSTFSFIRILRSYGKFLGSSAGSLVLGTKMKSERTSLLCLDWLGWKKSQKVSSWSYCELKIAQQWSTNFRRLCSPAQHKTVKQCGPSSSARLNHFVLNHSKL